MASNATPASARFDSGVIIRAAGAPLLFWAIVVAMASWQGYPGIACMTPMAWLLGTWAGVFCAERSRSAPQRRPTEALLAGALLGFGQGVVFALVSWLLMTPADAPAGDAQKLFTMALGMLVFGTLTSGLLGMWLAALRVRRMLS